MILEAVWPKTLKSLQEDYNYLIKLPVHLYLIGKRKYMCKRKLVSDYYYITSRKSLLRLCIRIVSEDTQDL